MDSKHGWPVNMSIGWNGKISNAKLERVGEVGSEMQRQGSLEPALSALTRACLYIGWPRAKSGWEGFALPGRNRYWGVLTLDPSHSISAPLGSEEIKHKKGKEISKSLWVMGIFPSLLLSSFLDLRIPFREASLTLENSIFPGWISGERKQEVLASALLKS